MSPALPEGPAETSRHTANILGTLSVLIQDRVEGAWQADLDLSPMAAAAIVQTEGAPGCSIEQVATRIGLSHSATVRVIDKLVERGLIEKDRARQDARQQSLTLSKAGKRLAQQLHAVRNDVTDALLGGIDAGQVTALHQAVCRILGQAVTSPKEGDVVCRVCDEQRCHPGICPITATLGD